MSRFINFISEEQIGNKMIFRATRLKGIPNKGKRQIIFYLKPNGQYFRWEGQSGSAGGHVSKDDMSKAQVDREIKAMSAIESEYKLEDFR